MFMLSYIDPAIVLSMFMLSFIFVIVYVRLEWKRICAGLVSFVYIYIVIGDLVNKRGRLGSHLLV